jgi:hypothetical protein
MPVKNSFLGLVGSLLLVGFSTISWAGDLPHHYNSKPLALSPVRAGTEMRLQADIRIPAGQALNKGAPSAVDIYEKVDGQWEKRKQVLLANIFHVDSTIRVDEALRLKQSDSELAVDSTLYHCEAKSKKFCVIESFQGTVSRSDKSTSELIVKIQGTPPRL